MVILRLYGAVTWLLAGYVLGSNAQEWPPCHDISRYHRGDCCMTGPGSEKLACPFAGYETSLFPRTACTTSVECSTPSCAGGGRLSVCENSVCVCKSPVDDLPPAKCFAAADCSLPDCTGAGKTVACKGGKCTCQKTGGDQGDPSPETLPTPTLASTQITKEGGVVVTAFIIHGGPITDPVTLTSAPKATIDVSGDAFHRTISSVSSKIVTDILPLATLWAGKPDPAKATKAVKVIEGLLPKIGYIAGGLPDGQRIFDCPEIIAQVKRRDANDVVLQLQKINCELLGILGPLERGQTSKDPAVVKSAQNKVHDTTSKIKSSLGDLTDSLGDGNDPSQACTEAAKCNLPDCKGDGKIKVCKNGKCTCKIEDSNPPATTCSANAECSSLPNCEGDGKTKVCREGKCICKKEDETSVTTTLTTLPPTASIETITDSVTENMVTTTTSGDSNDPTVVPIIVPVGKPPIICWNCVKLPANIKIKVPEFCVKILGTKIGNCPTEEEGNDNKNNNDDDDDDDDDDEEEEEEEKTTTISCTSTIAATYASVFCTLTGAPDSAAGGSDQNHKREAGCSTLAYKTTTACDTITGSTTTTTTTEEPTGLCRLESCGESSCSVGKRDQGLVKRAPPSPKTQPDTGDWYGPENYKNEYEFMRGEVFRAYQTPGNSVNLRSPLGEVTTGLWKGFGSKVETLALAGLWGCTAVIAVSKRGAWVAHFWENQLLEVGNALGDTSGGPTGEIDKGLGMFRGKDGEYGNMFNDDADPRIFIVTRGKRPSDKQHFFDSGADIFLVSLISTELKKWWKLGSKRGPQVEVIYPPINLEIPDQDPEYPGQQIPEWSNRYPGDPGFFTYRGKVMVQYQPALISCGEEQKIARQAGYRVWIQAKAYGKTSWEPTDKSQMNVVGNGNQKRAGSCAIHGDPSGNGDDSDGDGDDGGGATPLPKTCKTSADCSSPNCVGGSVVSACEKGVCVCKSPDDPSVCSKVDTCGHLKCKADEEKACKDKKCVCQERTCSATGGCGYLTCKKDQEKACKDKKCICQAAPDPSDGWSCEYIEGTYLGPPSYSRGPPHCSCSHADQDIVSMTYDRDCRSSCNKCKPWENIDGGDDDSDDDSNPTAEDPSPVGGLPAGGDIN